MTMMVGLLQGFFFFGASVSASAGGGGVACAFTVSSCQCVSGTVR